MHPGFKNVLGVFIGILIGMGVNIGLVTLGPILIPPPMDADLTTMEGLEASMHLMEPKHFLMPWLAHALGSFVGGLIAYLISGTNKMRSAYIVVFFFFLGGIANVTMLPSPLWFNMVDLGLAYIPMGWLACYVGGKVLVNINSNKINNIDIFKGNKNLALNIFNSLNWGVYIVETYKERLSPFAFLYNGNEKVKTILLQETDDDFLFAINNIKDENVFYDNVVIGYQTLIQIDEGKSPIEIIAVKGFDLHELNGHFFAQHIEQSGNEEYKKVDKPKYLGTFPAPLPTLNTVKENSVPDTFYNSILLKDGNRIKPVLFIGHVSETEMAELCKKYILRFLKEYDTKKLSGNFEINLIPREGIHKEFLTYLVKIVTKQLISDEYVEKELTQKLKPISIQMKYNEEIIYNDSTTEVVEKLRK